MTGHSVLAAGVRLGSPGPRDPVAIARLLGTSGFKEAIWDWQFGRKAGGITPVTAYIKNEPVGFNGLMAVDVIVDGQPVAAAWSCDFIVSRERRRHGLGRELKRELDKRCSFIMALGTSEAAAVVLAKAGWLQGTGPRGYVRVNTGTGLRALSRRFLQPMGRLTRALDNLVAERAALGWRSTEHLPDPAALDALWARHCCGYRSCVVRDSSYLQWRYSKHPLARYRFLEARRGSELEALAVYRESRNGERATLVDYVGPANAFSLKRSLVQTFARLCAHVCTLDCMTTDRELQRALVGSGFLPSRSGPLRFFVRSTLRDGPKRPATDWFLMGGDSDGEILAAAKEAAWSVREWTEEEFRDGRSEWQTLLANSDADRLFMGWDWQWEWWRHFGQRNALSLKLLAVYDVSGRLAGLAPLFLRRTRIPGGLRVTRLEPIGNVWGGPSTMRSEHLSLVLRRDQEEAIAKSIWQYAWERMAWDELVVQDWREGGPGHRELRDFMGPRAYCIDITDRRKDEARFLPLDQGFHVYLESLSGNARRSLYNKRRYLEELGDIELEYANPDNLEGFFYDLNRLHAIRWNEPVFSGHRLEFHTAIATRLARRGELRFSRLRLRGRVLSTMYHLRGGKREYNLQMGFDDKFHSTKISLGLLHLGYEAERAAGEGIGVLDLLAGGGKQGLFKHRIAAGRDPFVRCRYVRSLLPQAFAGSWAVARRLLGRR